jgi:hypothetical protein
MMLCETSAVRCTDCETSRDVIPPLKRWATIIRPPKADSLYPDVPKTYELKLPTRWY